jgi:hypothetical protein
MLLSLFHKILLVQPYQDTMYRITDRGHHFISVFAPEANYVLLLWSSVFVVFS